MANCPMMGGDDAGNVLPRRCISERESFLSIPVITLRKRTLPPILSSWLKLHCLPNTCPLFQQHQVDEKAKTLDTPTPFPTAQWADGAMLRFLGQFSHHLIGYATWLPPLIWFNSYVAQVTFISGPSMYPFLNPQYNESLKRDLCLVYKLYAQRNLERGMVVTFR